MLSFEAGGLLDVPVLDTEDLLLGTESWVSFHWMVLVEQLHLNINELFGDMVLTPLTSEDSHGGSVGSSSKDERSDGLIEVREDLNVLNTSLHHLQDFFLELSISVSVVVLLSVNFFQLLVS